MAIQIRSFGMSKMTIGSCSDFHNKVSSFLKEATAAALYVTDKEEAYNAAVETLASIVNRKRAFIATAEMKEADRRRDSAAGVISSVVSAYLTTPVETKSAAAQLLSPQLSAYKGIRSHEYTKQTAEIKGMLGVLDAPENKSAVTTLGLDEEVAALRTANEAFTAAFLSKAQEMSERQPQSDISSTDAVNEANTLYLDIVQTVNAYAIVKPSDALNKFIEKVNGLVGAYSRIAGSTSGSGSASDGTEEGGGSEDI